MSIILVAKIVTCALVAAVVVSAITNVWRLILSLVDRSSRKSRVKL